MCPKTPYPFLCKSSVFNKIYNTVRISYKLITQAKIWNLLTVRNTFTSEISAQIEAKFGCVVCPELREFERKGADEKSLKNYVCMHRLGVLNHYPFFFFFFP